MPAIDAIIRRVGEDREKITLAVREIMDAFLPPVDGKTVFIKPNLLGPFTPEDHVTTSPMVLEAVVTELESRSPARIMVGDNPGGLDAGSDSMDAAVRSGLLEASKGNFISLGESAVPVELDLDFAPKILVSKAWLEADVVINMPVFKTHLLTGFSGCLKNLFGIIPGAQKAKLHLASMTPVNFSKLLAMIYDVRVPDLNIIDGIWAMEGNGPSHGSVRKLGLLLGASDGAALDTIVARMMGFDPDRVPLLKFCGEMDLGKTDFSSLRIDGPADKIPDFKLPTTFPISPREQGMILYQLSTCVPELDPGLCVLCEKCVENCPAGALSIVDKKPVIEKEKCISCFCCVELCPEGAMHAPDSQALWNRMFTGE